MGLGVMGLRGLSLYPSTPLPLYPFTPLPLSTRHRYPNPEA